MKKIIIATHDGQFHADDALATAILQLAFEGSEIELIRTRNPELLAKADIVYDVGSGKFDHHSIDKFYRNNGIPYASAGLIWREFGSMIIGKSATHLTAENVTEVLKSVDNRLIQAVDAMDNGFLFMSSEIPVHTFSQMISDLNPNWNESVTSDEAFNEAVECSRRILGRILRTILAEMDAVSIVKEGLASRNINEVLVLPKACPWKKVVLELEEGNDVLYVVFPDSTGSYMVQVVPVELESFEARKSLPEAWAGKRDGELAELTGVGDAIFCHPARFIAGAQSLESALHMADLAVKA